MVATQRTIAERRVHVNRAARPTEACVCRRSLIDVEAVKTGIPNDPSARWVRRCPCGIPHYCGDLQTKLMTGVV